MTGHRRGRGRYNRAKLKRHDRQTKWGHWLRRRHGQRSRPVTKFKKS